MLRRRSTPTPPTSAEVLLGQVRAVAVEHRIAFRLARRLVDAPGSLATKKIAAALVAVADVLEPPGGPA